MKNATRLAALVALTSVLVVAAPVSAGEVVLEAVDSGNYDWEGDHSSGNTAYVAGDLAASGFSERRNFFVFDLSGVEGPILGATLEIYNPSNPPDAGNGYNSPDPFEAYSLWEVVTDVSVLTAGGTGLVGIFDDLGGGVPYGTIDITEADNGTIVAIQLNHNGENSIAAATGGLWAVGGAVMTLSGNPLQTVFAYGNGSMTRRLRLEIDDEVFSDGFEGGTTGAWSAIAP
jgi:hypothetical protein